MDPHDTSPEAAALQLDAWRRLGPEGRVLLAARLSDEIREITLAGIRERHPEYSSDEAFRALLRVVLGDPLVKELRPNDRLVDPLTASDFVARMIAMLEDAGIQHMLAGSFASAYHGTPRTTLDVDLVIDPSPKALETLVSAASQEGFYVDADRARDALRRRRQFNVIDPESGWKADLIIRKERPFSREEFQRRGHAQILGTRVSVASAEDTILSKLEWASQSDSDRQIADARGIVSARGSTLDRDYLERWATELGVLDLWRRISG